MQKALKAAVKRDRAARVVGISVGIRDASEHGVSTALHRKIKPLKRKSLSDRPLLHDKNGEPICDKAAEPRAVKEYLMVRGRGQLMPYADLVDKARARSHQKQSI